MKFAAVVPMSMQKYIQYDDYHLAVAHMCREREYFDFYRDTKGHLILDNGVAEKEPANVEDLLRLAYALGADEVVAPDVYSDMKRTLENLKGFMTVAQNYKVMAVLHAENWDEFITILTGALELGVSALALPRVMTWSMGPDARLEAAERIRKETDLPIHALGSTRRLNEGIRLAQQGIVRGMDSSAPVVLGLQGYGLDAIYSTGPRPKDFWELPETPEAILNLNLYRNQIRSA